MSSWIYLTDDNVSKPADGEFIYFTKNRSPLDYDNGLINEYGVYNEDSDTILYGLELISTIKFKDIMRWSKV